MEYLIIIVILAIGLYFVTGRAIRPKAGTPHIKNRHARRGVHGVKRR